MRHITSLLTLLVLATSTWVQAQSTPNANQMIPAQRPIAGTVTDNSGQPVPGARLWWGAGKDFIELTVDQSGQFRATSPIRWNLVEGPTVLGTLWAEADGYTPNGKTILGGDEQTRPELDLKVKLHRQPESAAAQLSVVDQEGQPIAEAIVELAPRNDMFPPEVRSRFSGRTDTNGQLKLTNPPLDGLYFRVTTAAHGTQDFDLISWHGAPKTRVLQFYPVGRLEVRIGGDEESRRGLRITVLSNGPMSNQESSQENLKRGASPFPTHVDISEVDSNERFTIPALIASKVNVKVQSPTDAVWLPEMPRQFDVAAGAPTSIEIPMTRGIPVTGRVVDGVTNAPLPGIALSVSSGQKTFSRMTTTTDRDGRFKTLAIPGRASVEVTSAASDSAGLYLLPPPIGGPFIEIEPDAKQQEFPEIRLIAARRIIGQVVSKKFPVQSWKVTVDKLPQSGRCDADGYFLLAVPVDLKPQKYTISGPGGFKVENRMISEFPLVLEMLDIDPNF